MTNLALFHRLRWGLPSLRHGHGGVNLVLVAMAGGLVVSLMARFAPDIGGHGIPEAMEAVLTNESRLRPITARFKPISAAIAIGTGGAVRSRGPDVVTGGALGPLVGQLLPVSRQSKARRAKAAQASRLRSRPARPVLRLRVTARPRSSGVVRAITAG